MDMLKKRLVRFEKHLERVLEKRYFQISWPHVSNLKRLISKTKSEIEGFHVEHMNKMNETNDKKDEKEKRHGESKS